MIDAIAAWLVGPITGIQLVVGCVVVLVIAMMALESEIENHKGDS